MHSYRCGPREVRVRHANNSILRRRHSAVDMTCSSVSLRRVQRISPREVKASKLLTTDLEISNVRHDSTMPGLIGDTADDSNKTQPVGHSDRYSFLPLKETCLSSCFPFTPSIQITTDDNTGRRGEEQLESQNCNWAPCLPETSEVGESTPKGKTENVVFSLGFNPQSVEHPENAEHTPPISLRSSSSMPDLGYAHHIHSAGSDNFSSISTSINGLGGSVGSTGFPGSSTGNIDLDCNVTSVPCDDSFHRMDVWPYESAMQTDMCLKSEATDLDFCFSFDPIPPHIAIMENPSEYYPFN